MADIKPQTLILVGCAALGAVWLLTRKPEAEPVPIPPDPTDPTVPPSALGGFSNPRAIWSGPCVDRSTSPFGQRCGYPIRDLEECALPPDGIWTPVRMPISYWGCMTWAWLVSFDYIGESKEYFLAAYLFMGNQMVYGGVPWSFNRLRNPPMFGCPTGCHIVTDNALFSMRSLTPPQAGLAELRIYIYKDITYPCPIGIPGDKVVAHWEWPNAFEFF